MIFMEKQNRRVVEADYWVEYLNEGFGGHLFSRRILESGYVKHLYSNRTIELQMKKSMIE